jgi:hypothetical protein
VDDGSVEFIAGQLRNEQFIWYLFDAEYDSDDQPFGDPDRVNGRHNL